MEKIIRCKICGCISLTGYPCVDHMTDKEYKEFYGRNRDKDSTPFNPNRR